MGRRKKKQAGVEYFDEDGYLTPEGREEIYKYNSQHAEMIYREDCEWIFCHMCGAQSDKGDIKEWCDNNFTAICPRCGIDAVLPSNCPLPMHDEGFLAGLCAATSRR